MKSKKLMILLIGILVVVLGIPTFMSCSLAAGKKFDNATFKEMDVFDISFVDAKTGWLAGVVGGSGEWVVLKTTDSGQTWIKQVSNPSGLFFGVDFIDKDHGAVLCSDGVLITQNGGRSWKKYGSATFAQAPSSDFYCIGYAACRDTLYVFSHGSLLWSEDGGKTWNVKEKPDLPDIHKVSLISPGDIMGVGANGRLYYDAGAVGWVEQDNIAGKVFDVCYINEAEGWIGGENGALYVTDSGGDRWQLLPRKFSGNVLCVSFVDKLNGWVQVKDDQMRGVQLWRTIDGGQTWKKLIGE